MAEGAAVNTQRNPHEEVARGRKVAKLLARCPAGDSRDANERAAATLEGYAPADRAAFAAAAGCLKPSDETWRQFVAAVRNRAIPGEGCEFCGLSDAHCVCGAQPEAGL